MSGVLPVENTSRMSLEDWSLKRYGWSANTVGKSFQSRNGRSSRWIAKYPEKRRFRSFHLNEMISPWKSWDEILEDYRAAKKENKETGTIEALKVFYNTSLGEVWRELGEGADDEELLSRR